MAVIYFCLVASANHPEPEPRTKAESSAEPVPGPSNQQADSGLPPSPKDVNEALQQRLHKYQQAAEKAKQEGNSSKSRRMGRIVKV